MGKVLMFHRVLPQVLIPQKNAYATFGTLIAQTYFEEVLQLLHDNQFDIVTISKLTELIKCNENTGNCIALTFDDGYSDNYDFAFPLLLKFGMTATFFPVVEPCKTNAVLPLDIYYHCVDEMELSQEEREELITGELKKKFYWEEPSVQKSMLKELFNTLPDKTNVSYMTAQQLKTLSQAGFEIGSHGMSHSLLTADYMTEGKIRVELKDSKEWLESIIGKPITAYCFPAGRYNSRAIELARDTGYTSTCLVFRDEDIDEALPSFERIFVKPHSIDELKKALNIS